MKTNVKSRIARLVTGCWLIAGLGSACGVTTSDNSETHFLGDCTDSCPAGLECICGVCTIACTESSACGELHPSAQCANSCSDTPDARVCDVPCTDDASCSTLGTNFECAAGRCRQAGELGSGGAGGTDAGVGPGATGGTGPSDGGRGGIGGGAGRAATGGAPPSGGTGGPAGGPGVPLSSADGRVDGTSNVLGIQGDLFGFADMFSAVGMTEDFVGMNACIVGNAAMVDLACTPVLPATDCYGMYWGAAIALNLNQPIDPETMMGVIPPLAYDASALQGFTFEITGSQVPTSLRFRVDTPTDEYCTPPVTNITPGANTVLFTDLRTECWTVGGEPGELAKPNAVRIVWQVLTNTMAVVPFDFCISNIRALQ